MRIVNFFCGTILPLLLILLVVAGCMLLPKLLLDRNEQDALNRRWVLSAEEPLTFRVDSEHTAFERFLIFSRLSESLQWGGPMLAEEESTREYSYVYVPTQELDDPFLLDQFIERVYPLLEQLDLVTGNEHFGALTSYAIIHGTNILFYVNTFFVEVQLSDFDTVYLQFVVDQETQTIFSIEGTQSPQVKMDPLIPCEFILHGLDCKVLSFSYPLSWPLTPEDLKNIDAEEYDQITKYDQIAKEDLMGTIIYSHENQVYDAIFYDFETFLFPILENEPTGSSQDAVSSIRDWDQQESETTYNPEPAGSPDAPAAYIDN